MSKEEKTCKNCKYLIIYNTSHYSYYTKYYCSKLGGSILNIEGRCHFWKEKI